MEKPIKVYRGEYLESTHNVHIAIVNTKGELQYSYGDPDRLTFPRSSMKPFQAVAVLETGSADAFHFEDIDIALIGASHSGEPRHRERVMKIIRVIGSLVIPTSSESYRQLRRFANILRIKLKLVSTAAGCQYIDFH